jgi:hypothetical protein
MASSSNLSQSPRLEGAPAAGGFNKWAAKPNNAGFNNGNDFVEEPKKKRQKTE